MPNIQSTTELAYPCVQILRTLRLPIETSRLGCLGVVAGRATTPRTVCLSRAHGVKATIDMDDLASRCGKPVRH